MKSAYVVACYFGPRRVHDKLYEQYPWVYVQEHVDRLSTLKHSFDQIVFVINGDDYIPAIPNKINDVPVEVMVRSNLGMSYGAWNYALLWLKKEYDYLFLIEDDYIPIVDNFDDIFMAEFKENTGYVCSLFDRGHAAITNGIVKVSAVNHIGGIPYANNALYSSAEQLGQVALSKLLDLEGFGTEHIAPKYSVPFLDAHGGIIYYGVPGGQKVISPVLLERG